MIRSKFISHQITKFIYIWTINYFSINRCQFLIDFLTSPHYPLNRNLCVLHSVSSTVYLCSKITLGNFLLSFECDFRLNWFNDPLNTLIAFSLKSMVCIFSSYKRSCFSKFVWSNMPRGLS